ncbi:MAG: hypothetical protein R3E32_26850 [Chitinophagales bacterium]
MENIFTFLFAIIFLLIVFATVIVWIYYRYVKHTRERFAFFSVATLSGFMLSAIGLLMVQYPFFNWLIGMTNQQFGTNLPPYQQEEIWLNAGSTCSVFLNLQRILDFGRKK